MPHLNNLNPLSTSPVNILAATGSESEVNLYSPYKIYSDPVSPFYSVEYLSGAADQVTYTYNKIGGNILDVEITAQNIYANYEEATLEYSYILNLHQAKNSLNRMLGTTTGTFDHNGNLASGSLLYNQLSGSHVNLKYPRFSFESSNKVMQGISAQLAMGQSIQEYSASFNVVLEQQDYDLQTVVKSLASSGEFGPYFSLGNKRVKITKVYYMTPQSMWRFYGQYGMGGMQVLGNLGNYSGYGQFSDDSTWEVVPVWQNILQGMAYKTAINVRCSNYSYDLYGSKLRLYPQPQIYSPAKMWFKFVLEDGDPWNERYEEDGTREDSGLNGVNNVNTAPLEVLTYQNINSIGKNFIKRFCYCLTMETLGRVRSKFSPVPIPNSNVTLDGKELLSEAKDCQKGMREELMKTLDELTYTELAKKDAELLEAVDKVAQKIPSLIYKG